MSSKLADPGLNEAALADYLRDHIPGLGADLTMAQFDAGQSNPTYRLQSDGRTYVLRKRPPGKLLPSAHAVDREHRIMAALKDTAVPVPPMLHLCQDPSIIGTDFFVMEFVEGAIHHDPGLPGLSPADRALFYRNFIHTLATLHAVDPDQVGLSDFGKPDGYLERQVARWSGQYEKSRTDDIPSMQKLVDWLPANAPKDASVSIVHGDFRPGNCISDARSQDILAVLDWELSTLGHPLADLGYCLAGYHGAISSQGNFNELPHADLGIPTEEEFIDLYCQFSGRRQIENVHYYVVFSLFRSAAIIQGVYKRGLQGNASSKQALGFGNLARQRADAAWNIVTSRL
ncbi:phosphotransferase family protein [Rhodovibrionaceae bacterium A322]